MATFGEFIDNRLTNAIIVAREWELGNATVLEARNVSRGAIALANESVTQSSIAVARSVGHAVAMANIAYLSLKAAEYVLKAIKESGKSVETVRSWQDVQLSKEIRKIVLSSRTK